MCVDLDDPTIRFFTRDVGGNGKANLKVDVLYENFNGGIRHLTIARLKATDDRRRRRHVDSEPLRRPLLEQVTSMYAPSPRVAA